MAKILLVEDNEMIRDLASRRLKRRGYEVTIATDGAAGVEKARGERPDLVIMDMGLPVIDGYEATRLLKASGETRHLPVIGLSAHAMSGDAQKALDAGCDDYDTKPIEWPRLLDKIQALLARAEARAEAAPASAEGSGSAAATGESSATGAAFRVLVVDDSALNRDLLGRRLAAAGHEVETAVSGEEALARAAVGGFDAALLDVAPGDLDGEEVLRRLREDEATRELPVLMLCPVDASDRAVACLALGADDFVPQPFRPEILQARLQSAVERHRLREKERRAKADLAEERKRGDHLLRVLLPEPVVEELKSTRRILPRRHPEAAILACGVQGLDRLLENDPTTAIGHLQELIGLFEDATARHGLEKIKTHRDLLLAAAGLYTPPPDGPVLAAVRCALELLEKAPALPGGLTIRCGVHLGPAVSGVVGKRRYQFDLWGSSVRTAERVRDIGDGLHLTRAAWQQVEGRVQGGEIATPAGPAYRVDAVGG